MPRDAADELAHDLGPLGIAEVEVVGDGERPAAHGGEVAPGLRHGLLAALERVGLAIARRHVGGQRERPSGRQHAHDGGVAARPLHGVADDRGGRTAPRPSAWSRGPGEPISFSSASAFASAAGTLAGAIDRLRAVGDVRPVIERRLVAELLDRQVGHDLALVPHHEAQRVGGLADDREVEAPLAEDRLGLLLLARARAP